MFIYIERYLGTIGFLSLASSIMAVGVYSVNNCSDSIPVDAIIQLWPTLANTVLCIIGKPKTILTIRNIFPQNILTV